MSDTKAESFRIRKACFRLCASVRRNADSAEAVIEHALDLMNWVDDDQKRLEAVELVSEMKAPQAGYRFLREALDPVYAFLTDAKEADPEPEKEPEQPKADQPAEPEATPTTEKPEPRRPQRGKKKATTKKVARSPKKA